MRRRVALAVVCGLLAGCNDPEAAPAPTAPSPLWSVTAASPPSAPVTARPVTWTLTITFPSGATHTSRWEQQVTSTGGTIRRRGSSPVAPLLDPLSSVVACQRCPRFAVPDGVTSPRSLADRLLAWAETTDRPQPFPGAVPPSPAPRLDFTLFKSAAAGFEALLLTVLSRPQRERLVKALGELDDAERSEQDGRPALVIHAGGGVSWLGLFDDESRLEEATVTAPDATLVLVVTRLR